MPGYKPEVVGDTRCELGEGPVWDERTGTIHWLDILKGRIYNLTSTKEKPEILSLGQMVGSISLCENGGFIAGLEKGIYFVDRQSGELDKIGWPEVDLPGNRCNDGKCDPAGRFWVGTMSKSEDKPTGSLYSVDQYLNIVPGLSGTIISNGMAWSPDEKTFYFIDSPTQSVDAFDYDKISGEISNRRQIISFKSENSFPDGMTIDNDGMLWIANWGGWRVSRWNPLTGEKLLSIPLPVAHVTSCTFGGSLLNDLYITTARKGLSAEKLKEQPLAGALFVVKGLEFKGMVANRFSQKQ